MASSFTLGVVCPPGLESVCADELTGLGLRPKPAGPGVVEAEANRRQLYLANVWLRTAGRVLVRVATFRATDFIHLAEHASRIDWDRWIPAGHAPAFRVTAKQSKLYHTKAVAQRLHQISAPPSIDEPEQLFVVRIERNTVTISADSSGTALHHRPWRTNLVDAPLRTTMAAALLNLSGWEPSQRLVDPFCGSGTIPIEAALIRAGLPPGGEREFAFHTWNDFEPGSWASVVASIDQSIDRAGERPGAAAPILGSDRDSDAVVAARANAEAAGVGGLVDIDSGVVSHLVADRAVGHIVTNPPYGKRIGGDNIKGLYRRLGVVARDRLPGHHLTVVTSERDLARAVDRRLKPVAGFRHGGLKVEVFHRDPHRSDSDSSPLKN